MPTKLTTAKKLGLLTVQQVADLVGCDTKSVRNWIAAGTCEAVIVPGARPLYLITVEEAKRLKAEKGKP